jgi:hypothetical protein
MHSFSPLEVTFATLKAEGRFPIVANIDKKREEVRLGWTDEHVIAALLGRRA